MNRRSIAYDFVMILDGSTSIQRDRGSVSRSLARSLCRRGVDQITAHASSDEAEEIQWSVVQTIEDCLRKARMGQRFLIHLVGRGNREGLFFGARGRALHLPWPYLSDLLDGINHAMKGNLLVNVVSCRGLHGKAFFRHPVLQSPAYNLVGALRPLTAEEARKVNTLFYEQLVEGTTVQDTVRTINRRIGRAAIYFTARTGRRKLSKSLWNRHPGLRVRRRTLAARRVR